MARKDFWKSDWFLGVAVAVAVLVISRTDFVQSMERKAYDLGVWASNRMPGDRIAVITIDNNSIANIGRWPWPRGVHAELIDGPKGAHVLSEAESALNTDRKLADSVAAAGNVAVLTEIGQRAASIRHLNSPDDVDGAIRTEPILLAYFDNQQAQERFATGDQLAKAFRECAEVFGIADVAL